jgi:hypothetical protein
MATVKTNQGEFEVCNCGNPDGHAGPVWHPEQAEHPSGAKLAKGQKLPGQEANE